MKNIKKSPIIILDIILGSEETMSKIEKLIFKILKAKNKKMNEDLINIREISLYGSSLWIAELKKDKNRSVFVLYSSNLTKFSKEYERIETNYIECEKKLLAYPGGKFLPLEFKFFKNNENVYWTMKIHVPKIKIPIKKINKNKRSWVKKILNL